MCESVGGEGGVIMKLDRTWYEGIIVLFPGPTQLSVALSILHASDGKPGRAWE